MKDNRWLALTCSRNDGDMIEAFIRGNSHFIDQFVILDDSNDSTTRVLELLKKEGYDIVLLRHRGLVASQKDKINYMFQKFANPRKFSAAIPLDVDEILVPVGEATYKADMQHQGGPMFLKWLPFAPKQLDWVQDGAELADLFVGTSNQLNTVRKVFIPSKAFSKHGQIEVGAHNYFVEGATAVFDDNQELAIAHFPIRSRAQILSKVLTQISAVRIKKKKIQGESLHLPPMARFLLDTKGRGIETELEQAVRGLQMLQTMSAFYADFSPKKGHSFNSIVFNENSKLLPQVRFKYREVGKVDLSDNLIRLVSELTERIVELDGIPIRDDKPYRYL